MKKYTRVTKYNEYIHNAEVYAYSVVDEDIYFDGVDIVSNESSGIAQEAIDRLAEFEDKIENGTLIELPCKVGEPFYEIDTLYCEYRKHEVGGFSFDDGELIIIDYFDSRYKASEVCFSQAEAEAKLKELKYDILVKYKNNQGSGIPLCKECMKDLTLALFAKLNEIKEQENER